MAKTQEELIQLKKEYENLNTKLKELSEDELKMVTGGSALKQLDCVIQSFLNEESCFQEVAVAEKNQVIQPQNSIPHLFNNDLSHHEYNKYSNSKTVFKCKMCGYLNLDLFEIQNHVKNVHNGDTNMIEPV